MGRIMAEAPRVYEQETEQGLVKELQWALAIAESKSFEAKATFQIFQQESKSECIRKIQEGVLLYHNMCM